MIIHTSNNILAGPLLLTVWALDVYVFLVCLRLFLSRFPGDAAAKACQGLQVITDPLPTAVGHAMARRCSRRVRAWVPWLLVLLVAASCRCLMLGLLFLALR
jgi:uncharacterized protein YggT (Ycf19 family)